MHNTLFIFPLYCKHYESVIIPEYRRNQRKDRFAEDRYGQFFSVTSSWGLKQKKKNAFFIQVPIASPGSDVFLQNLFSVFNLERIENFAMNKRIYPSNSLKKFVIYTMFCESRMSSCMQ